MSRERQLLRTVEFALETFIESGYFPNEQLLLDTIKELFNQPKHIVAVTDTVEPVAWMYDHHIEVGYDKHTEFNIVDTCARNLEFENCINVRPLYLAPPTREPLSEDKIAKLWGESYSGTTQMVRNFARAIEKAHGIGGEPLSNEQKRLEAIAIKQRKAHGIGGGE